jgi:uncharacterized membrane protein
MGAVTSTEDAVSPAAHEDDVDADVDVVVPVDEVPVRPLPRRAWVWLRRRTAPQWALVAAIAAYTAYFTVVTLRVHHGLGTSAYDYGLYDQGIWLMSRFESPFVTLMGRNLMGDHTSFILLLIVPLYWLFPAAGTLFFVQSLVVGLGALPVFLYARRRLEHEWFAVVLGLCYLLHPAVAWTNRENFHPDAFVGVLVGFAIYGALERKWRLYAVFVVLSLMVKEDVSLVIVPLGIWVALRRDRRIGLITILGSLSFMILAMFVIMRSLIGVPTRNLWRIPFGGPTGVIRETIERPGNVVDHFRSDHRPFYFWQMTFPTAWVFARLPDVAMISALVLFTNMLSTYWYQYQVEYHYSLIAVPALVIGTAYAIGAIRAHLRKFAVGAVAVASLWSCLMWGAIPLGSLIMPWNDDPIGREIASGWPPSHPSAVAARELVALVPEDAPVSAHHAITAHLARREQVYMFPNPFRVVLYGPNTDLEAQRLRLPEADDIEYVFLQTQLDDQTAADWAAESDRFEVVASNDYWVLYRRLP